MKRRNFWCWLGLHRWEGPGLKCRQCFYPDVIFDPPEVGKERIRLWNDYRQSHKEETK